MAKFYLLSTVLLLVAHGFAVPSPQASDIVYHCGNGVDTCPNSDWTCCGPILAGIGGICRKLKPDEVCAL